MKGPSTVENGARTDLPGGPAVKTLRPHCRRVWVWFLVGELRSHMPCYTAENRKGPGWSVSQVKMGCQWMPSPPPAKSHVRAQSVMCWNSCQFCPRGLLFTFEITQIIYSENALNWRIKKSEISNPMNLGLGFLDFIHISALELTGGLEQAAERFVHLQRYIKYSDSHPRAYSKDARECFWTFKNDSCLKP